jgi:hypothetical protein
MAEYEDAVMCLFRADEVITFAAKMLPTIKLGELLSEKETT